ncbi:MAG: 16S rRNA processing protein RimM [Sphingomonadaceae bacterium]|nr:16S rRNA processing protein RimM [Sphingomonadaceae bacterium]
MAATDKRITLAAIAGAHGIGGEVRLKLFAESLESFKQHKVFDASGQALTLKSVRQTGKMPIARFAEIADRNTAEALRGTELTIARSALPPLEAGEYYYADLVGLPCVTEDGQQVGEVIAVENFGAGDILDVRRKGAVDFMVPVAAVIIETEKIIVSEDHLP